MITDAGLVKVIPQVVTGYSGMMLNVKQAINEAKLEERSGVVGSLPSEVSCGVFTEQTDNTLLCRVSNDIMSLLTLRT